FPAHIPQTAVYTKSDGVVDWSACLNDNPRTDIEVRSTHVGIVWNAEAYRVIAARLQAAEAFLAQAREQHRQQQAGVDPPLRVSGSRGEGGGPAVRRRPA